MMRIKLVVAYDGTGYSGWQLQKNAVTIEQKLNEALTNLLEEEINVTGASRTDAGVHSLGNVCVFDTETRIPAEKICFALNARLPEDIVVQSSCEVAADFHPRAGKSSKTYEYRILNRIFPDPTRRRDTYFYHYPLDIKAMQKAAKEQEKLQKSALKERPKFRSLHYIDEDDYDELPELKKNQNNKNSSPDRPVIKD